MLIWIRLECDFLWVLIVTKPKWNISTTTLCPYYETRRYRSLSLRVNATFFKSHGIGKGKQHADGDTMLREVPLNRLQLSSCRTKYVGSRAQKEEAREGTKGSFLIEGTFVPCLLPSREFLDCLWGLLRAYWCSTLCTPSFRVRFSRGYYSRRKDGHV